MMVHNGDRECVAVVTGMTHSGTPPAPVPLSEPFEKIHAWARVFEELLRTNA
jgi:hypothetical protein